MTESNQGKKNSIRNVFCRLLFVALGLTWCLPQSLLGFCLFLKNRKEPHEVYRGAVHTLWPNRLSGVSLGLFIFTGKDCISDMKDHEFGHCLQSLLLGPFYLFVIGIPSLFWNRKWQRDLKRTGHVQNYFTFYTERWAEKIKASLPELPKGDESKDLTLLS